MDETREKKIYLFLEKLKKDKKTAFIILVAFLGILLISLSEFVPDNEAVSENTYSQSVCLNNDAKAELEDIISKIDGVGKVSVMITYEGTEENIYALNMTEQSNVNDVKRDEEYLILDKGNDEDGLLVKKVYPRVTGIAVVCVGGGNPAVKNEITHMLKALYNISSNSISISEMNS